MIQPENDVAVVSISIVKVWPRDGNGLVRIVGEDGQGTGSIEADAADRGFVNTVLVYSSSD